MKPTFFNTPALCLVIIQRFVKQPLGGSPMFRFIFVWERTFRDHPSTERILSLADNNPPITWVVPQLGGVVRRGLVCLHRVSWRPLLFGLFLPWSSVGLRA
jgi:hypothetical protein